MKKILFILPSFAGGGAEKVTISFINSLDRKKYNVKLIVLNDGGKLKHKINKDVEVHNLNRIRLRYSLFRIISKINLLKPEIIFSTFINVNIFLLFLKFFYSKLKFVIRAESVPSNHCKHLPYPRLYKFFYKILYKKSDLLISSCGIIKDEFIESGALSKNIVTIPNPVENLKLINKNEKIRHPGNGTRLVAAGRLSKQKGYDYLLYVISKINKNIHCTIMGDGELEYQLKKMVTDLNIEDKISFIGYINNPYPYLNGADALMITSNFEGLPNIALESLALGVPVYSTPECGGLKELKHVNIFERDKKFINAISDIKVNEEESRKTLLDNKFNINNVMKIFTKSIDQI